MAGKKKQMQRTNYHSALRYQQIPDVVDDNKHISFDGSCFAIFSDETVVLSSGADGVTFMGGLLNATLSLKDGVLMT